MDNCYLKDNRPSHTILSKYQSSCDDYPQIEKTQTLQVQKKSTQLPSSGSLWLDNNDFAEKKVYKEKKMKFCLEQAWKDLSTLAIGFNTTSTNTNGGRDLNQIVCYNCNKKEHLLRNCPEPNKNMSKN